MFTSREDAQRFIEGNDLPDGRAAFVGNTQFETWLADCEATVRAGDRPHVRADCIPCDFINDEWTRRFVGIDFTKAIEAIRGQIAQAGEDTGDPVMAECWEINV